MKLIRIVTLFGEWDHRKVVENGYFVFLYSKRGEYEKIRPLFISDGRFLIRKVI